MYLNIIVNFMNSFTVTMTLCCYVCSCASSLSGVINENLLLFHTSVIFVISCRYKTDSMMMTSVETIGVYHQYNT